MSQKIRVRREKLYQEQNGSCYWCSIKTIMPIRNQKNTYYPNNLATIDHLRTKMEDSRKDPNHNNEERLVLSCLKCNELRAKLSMFCANSLGKRIVKLN